MATIDEKNVILRFRAETEKAEKDINDLGKGIKRVDTNADKAAAATKKLGKEVKGLGGITKQAVATFAGFAALQAVQAVGRQIGTLASKSLDLAVSAEQTSVAFTTFLGSAEKARTVIAQLNEFSELTPFEPEQVLRAGQSLLAFGIPAGQLVDTLKALGDVSAGTGTDFNELSEIFGKAKVQGRLFAEDINQLTGRGIPIIAEFAKQFGVAESEVKDLVKSGVIGFDNLEQAFVSLTSEGGKFFDLTAKQSQTLGGRISTLKGQFDGFLRSLGERFLPIIGDVTDKFSSLARSAKAYVEIPLSKEIENERLELQTLVRRLANTNLESEKRVEVINELKTKYPDYLKNINAETVGNNELFDSLEKVNKSLIKKVVFKAQEEETSKAILKANEALEAQERATLDVERAQTKLTKALEAEGFTFDLVNEGIDDVTATLRGYVETAKTQGRTSREIALAAVELLTRNEELTIATNEATSATFDQEVAFQKLNDIGAELNTTVEDSVTTTKKSSGASEDDTKSVNKRIAAIRKLEALIRKQAKTSINVRKQIEESQVQPEALDPQIEAEAVANVERRIALAKILASELIKTEGKSSERIIAIEKALSLELMQLDLERIAAELQTVERGTQEALDLREKFAAKEAEIQKASVKVAEDAEKAKREATKKTLAVQLDNARKILDSTSQIANEAIGGAKDVLLAQVKALDARIEAQEEAVRDSLKLAEKGSTELLEVEERRLDDLNNARQRAAQRLRVINQIEVTANQALAISQGIVAVTAAFAPPGNVVQGIAASIALAATIASATVSLNNAFSDTPAFATGTEFFKGAGTGTSDSNLARISHGERVVPADVNSKYFTTLNEFQRGSKTADLLHSIALRGLPVIQSNSGALSGDVITELTRVKKSIDKLSVNVSLDSDGFAASIERMQSKRQKMRNKLG